MRCAPAARCGTGDCAFQAHIWGASARAKLGATGFQIRDLRNQGCIVTLEDFNGPPPTLH